MTLLCILISGGLQRLLDFGSWFKLSWFKLYLNWWQSVLNKVNNWLAIIIIIVPILLMLAIINYIVGGYFLGLLKLLVMIALLLSCLNVKSLRHELVGYFAAMEKGDLVAAFDKVKHFLGQNSHNEGQHIESDKLIREVTQAIFTRSFVRIFAILFWFIIFGTYGAISYFVVTMLDESVCTKEIQLLKEWFDWLPLRLLAISFALVGHFVHEFSFCLKHLWCGFKGTKVFVHDFGLAALNVDPESTESLTVAENYAAISLIDRALIVWIVVVAIFTLGAWLS